MCEDMRDLGIIFKQEPLEQNVGLWLAMPRRLLRFLSESKQWFVRINAEEIKKTAEEIEWIPSAHAGPA